MPTISLPAIVDLGEIWDYIAADNNNAADALLETFHEKFELLQTMPEAGRERKTLKGSPRSFLLAATSFSIAFCMVRGILIQRLDKRHRFRSLQML